MVNPSSRPPAQGGSTPSELGFQDYQRAFTAHIRDPRGVRRPQGAQARRMRVYNELLYNNVEGFLLACFPVSRDILGKRRWARLTRAFFRDHVSHSPYFRQIPEEFLRFLRDECQPTPEIPDFLPELAHYEWVELALETSNRDAKTPAFIPDGDLLTGRPLLNPVTMILAYRYPVHRLSRSRQPASPPDLPTFILAFRTADTLEIRFQAISALAAQLLNLLLTEPPACGRDLLLALARESCAPDPDSFLRAGANLLNELRLSGAILGVRADSD